MRLVAQILATVTLLIPSLPAYGGCEDDLLGVIEPQSLARRLNADSTSYFFQVPEAQKVLSHAARLLATPLAEFPDPRRPMLLVENLVGNLKRQAAEMELVIRGQEIGPALEPAGPGALSFINRARSSLAAAAETYRRITGNFSKSVSPHSLNTFREIHLAKAYRTILIGFLPGVTWERDPTSAQGANVPDVIFDGGRAWAVLRALPVGDPPEFGWASSPLAAQARALRRRLTFTTAERPKLHFISIAPVPPGLRTELEKHFDLVTEIVRPGLPPTAGR